MSLTSKPCRRAKLSSLCMCEVCHQRELGPSKKMLLMQRKRMREMTREMLLQKWSSRGTEEISFAQLLQYLVSSSQLVKGVPVLVPETLVFSRQKLVALYKYKVDELVSIKGPYNLPRVTRIVLSGQKRRFRSSERNKVFPTVIVRKKSGYKLLTESEFIGFMMEPPSSPQWLGIQYIQSYILDKHGLASPLNYDYEIFFKNFNPEKALSSSKFEPDSVLRLGDGFGYAKKLCAVLGYYLFKVHRLELLAAKISFMRDNVGNFWLSYAKDIFVRKNPQLNNEWPGRFQLIFSGLEKSIQKAKSKLTHKDEAKVGEYSRLMQSNYEGMKRRLSICREEKKDRDELGINTTFEVLRPESPYKLSEIISPCFDPKAITTKRMKEGKRVTGRERQLAEMGNPFAVKSVCFSASGKIARPFSRNSALGNTHSLARRSQDKAALNETAYHKLIDAGVSRDKTASRNVRTAAGRIRTAEPGSLRRYKALYMNSPFGRAKLTSFKDLRRKY